MKLKVLGGFGGKLPFCNMTSFLINDTVLLDGGSIANALPLKEQARIKHAIISHSHFDHINGLPFFVDNVFGQNTASINLFAQRATLKAIREHMFNNVTWPDFSKILSNGMPLLAYRSITAGKPFSVENLQVTGIKVNHIVPTLGFVVEESGGSAIVYTSDTGATDEIWKAANAVSGLKAVIIECSFPNKMEKLAIVSKHLTPAMMAREIEKLDKKVPIYIYHIKPSHQKIMEREIAQIQGWEIGVLKKGATYKF